jgi:hypothetical protein
MSKSTKTILSLNQRRFCAAISFLRLYSLVDTGSAPLVLNSFLRLLPWLLPLVLSLLFMRLRSLLLFLRLVTSLLRLLS